MEGGDHALQCMARRCCEPLQPRLTAARIGSMCREPFVPDDEQVLWWSKGGELRGTSPRRIEWFRDYATSPSVPPFGLLGPLSAAQAGCECACTALVAEGEYAFFHLRPDETIWGKSKPRPSKCTLGIPGLPPGARFRVTALHWWEMVSEVVIAEANSSVAVWVGEFGVRAPRNIELRRV